MGEIKGMSTVKMRRQKTESELSGQVDEEISKGIQKEVTSE